MRLITPVLFIALLAGCVTSKPANQSPPATQEPSAADLAKTLSKLDREEKLVLMGSIMLADPSQDFKVHLIIPKGQSDRSKHVLIIHGPETSCCQCEWSTTTD